MRRLLQLLCALLGGHRGRYKAHWPINGHPYTGLEGVCVRCGHITKPERVEPEQHAEEAS